MTSTLASIERRLAKMETARKPPRGLFFAAWGHTADEIEAALARARRAGTIADGDPVVRCAWPPEYPMPASRWVLDKRHDLDRPEFGALMGEVDRLQDAWIAALRAEMAERGEPAPPPPPPDAVLPERDALAATKNDAALFAIILAVPLGGPGASLTAHRATRVVRHMAEAGLRDRIRGRDAAMRSATGRAGQITRH